MRLVASSFILRIFFFAVSEFLAIGSLIGM